MVFLRCKRHDRVIEQCNFLSQGLKAIKEGDEASNEISGKLAEVRLYDLTNCTSPKSFYHQLTYTDYPQYAADTPSIGDLIFTEIGQANIELRLVHKPRNQVQKYHR